MAIQIKLLGPVQIEKDDGVIHQFRSRKSVALLGYLAIRNQTIDRSRLAALLWPDKSESKGRRDLRWTLNYLSKLLPNTFSATRQTITFAPPESVSVDTGQFEALVNRADADSLAAAAALYRDDLMANLYLDDCPEFELWLLQEGNLATTRGNNPGEADRPPSGADRLRSWPGSCSSLAGNRSLA